MTEVKTFKFEQKFNGTEDLYGYIIKNVNILAGTFDVDIVVFFMPKVSKIYLESLNWLQKICNVDTEFIVGEVNF